MTEKASRIFFASYQHGEPVRDLQALAGHATAAFTLQRYTHQYDASARRIADAMDDAVRG